MRRVIASGGYDGFILDAGDISTLNQVSTGTTPVTAVTQPIGLMLDKHLGMGLGPELCAFSSLTSQGTGWVFSGGVLHKNADDAIAYDLGTAVVAGKAYEIRYTKVNHTAGDPTVTVGGTAYAAIIANADVDGSYVMRLKAGANGTIELTGNAARIDFTAISVKLLDGNHPIQATAAARPSWQVDANGYHYAQILGTDDSLSCATGGGGSTGFLFCCALKPGGAGTLRTIYSDTGTNTGYKVQIDANNKLSFSAGDNAAFTTKVSTADFAVGTTYLLTVWDDGTNLNVQINSAAAETVGRPVVVAGTAGYTLGKDNGAASSFLIADFYRADYIKNWAGTAAQLAAIQSWVKAGAGL